MAYGRKYYFTFKDTHVSTPATWRVDILDSEGLIPAEPLELKPSPTPLLTERIDTSERKDSYIIGRQVTISYEYDGESITPLPSEFFEQNERRFRVEVRKNNVLDGVYYIKPDFSEYDDKSQPFTVQLKAVDGFAYAKAIQFNIYEDERIFYDKVSWYEAIVTRALLEIMDPDTKLNVINSLSPTNIAAGVKLLFGSYVHTDIFYDFVKGASSVHDVLTAFCRSMYSRCYICNNEVWLVRTQDLTSDTFTVDQYINDTTVNEVEIPGFVSTVGNDPGLYNGVRIDNVPRIRMVPAIKEASFKADYKAINRLTNFDWYDFGDYGVGDQFQFWGQVTGNAQVGSGTIDDPYRAYLPYNDSLPGEEHLQQQVPSSTSPGPAQYGDIVQLQFRWKVTNVEGFRIAVWIQSANPGNRAFLDASGSWVPEVETLIDIKRTKRKRLGSFDIKSAPIPNKIGAFGPSNFDIFVQIYTPNPKTDPDTQDGPDTPSIEIWPIKLGISSSSSVSRISRVKNTALFSQIKDEAPFTFFDSGDLNLSNTIFVQPFTDYEAVTSWNNDKTGVSPADIERHMSEAHIDQYPRSIISWEASLYSNSIEFYNVFDIDSLPGKRFMQMSDKYNNQNCTHDILLMEVFEEGNADITYDEYDIDDETD
jgi:hypothetical protein